MPPRRVHPNIIEPKRCDDNQCPFFRVDNNIKHCWLYKPTSMINFRTYPKPDWCKLERIEIHEKLKKNIQLIPRKALAEGHCKSLENAKRLIEDGEILIKNERYIGAINSLRLAYEELAKAHLITQAASYKEEDDWEWFWYAFSNHKEKLRLLEHELSREKHMNKNEFHQRIKVLIETREKSIYVHFDRETKRFFTPKEIFEFVPTIKDTAQLEFSITSALFMKLAPLGIPTPKEVLLKFQLYQEEESG